MEKGGESRVNNPKKGERQEKFLDERAEWKEKS